MRDTNDLFLRAAREKWRFPSKVGELTAEQIWELPLTATRANAADLDSVAKAVNAELKAASEESFVAVRKNPARNTAEGKLDLVRVIIAVKQDEAAASQKRAKRAEDLRLLREAAAEAEIKELTTGSKDDLMRRIAELEAEDA